MIQKTKAFFQSFRYIPILFQLVWKTDRIYLIYMLLETACFALMPFPTIILVKYAMDALERATPFSQYAFVCMALVFLQLALSLLKSYFNSARPNRTSVVTGKLYNTFHRKSMELDYQLLAEKEIQELQAFAGAFINRKLSNTVWNFIWLFSGMISFAVSAVLLISVSVWLIVIVAVGMALNTVVLSRFTAVNRRINSEMITNDRHIAYLDASATDYGAAKDIRIFDLGEKMKRRASGAIANKFRLHQQQELYANIQGAINFLFSHGIELVVYCVLGVSVLHGDLSIGMFSLAVSNIALVRQYFDQISSTLLDYVGSAKYIEHYNRFVSLESAFRKTGKKPLPVMENENYTIEFRNVSFQYPGQSGNTLNNFNVVVRGGEKISVVGENGAGKSTFVKLLTRLYDPTEGEILLNGVNIKEIDYDEYLSVFTTVFQDFKLFAFTVDENISSFAYGKREKVQHAAEKTGIADRINELPAGYDTCLTKLFDENGVEFSGGEQQKLALARAYFKDKALVTILDEPTSALDPKAEYLLYKQFRELVLHRTAFFISHRLSSAQFCDKIMVIQNGAVAEFGPHDKLLQQNGIYAALYRLQSSYYQTTSEG